MFHVAVCKSTFAWVEMIPRADPAGKAGGGGWRFGGDSNLDLEDKVASCCRIHIFLSPSPDLGFTSLIVIVLSAT